MYLQLQYRINGYKDLNEINIDTLTINTEKKNIEMWKQKTKTWNKMDAQGCYKISPVVY